MAGQSAAPTAAVSLMTGPPPFPCGALVTLGNWQDPPFNRWAFQHIRELIPTARIARGDRRPRRLARAERDVLSLSYLTQDRELTVADLLDETCTDGFLVLHRGQIVTEQYRNGMTPATPHLLMSVSKSVTSAVAGVLAGRGELDVAAAVTDVLPGLRGTSFDGATVQHLLDMRAGTRFDETYDNPESDVRAYERVYLWRPDEPGEDRSADALSYYATLPNDGPHGGPFRYRSILTDVLGWVLERAGGARLHELIARELWQPMGAEFDAEVTVDGHGNAMADGGVCATLRDLARFGAGDPGGGARPRPGGAGRLGRGHRSAARPTAWPRSAMATAAATRPARTTATAGGSGTPACRSSTPRASTGSTSWCTCRRRRSWSSCPPGRWPPASGSAS